MIPEGKRSPAYVRIREYVRSQIAQGRWKPNDRLPTEAEFAEQFGISRFPVKKALAGLAEEGVIYRIQGKGSFVAASAAAAVPESASAISTESAAAPTVTAAAAAAPRAARGGTDVAFIASHLRNPLLADILDGAEEVLAEHGMRLTLRTSRNDPAAERELLREAVRTGAGGILIFPVDGEEYNEELLRLTLERYPVVVIDRYLRGVHTNCVCSDHEGGAYQAVSHLIGLGHRHIGYVSFYRKPTTSLADRRSGYERALAEQRLPAGESLIRFDDGTNDFDFENAVADAQRFLAEHPHLTAVFGATSFSGLAVMEAARRLGRNVPEELSVIFFDDVEHAGLHRVPPSCVVQPQRELGREAAKLLLAVIADPAADRRRITLPTRFIERSSAAPPPEARPSRS